MYQLLIFFKTPYTPWQHSVKITFDYVLVMIFLKN